MSDKISRRFHREKGTRLNNKFKANAALLLSAVGAAFTIPSVSPVAPISPTGNFLLGLFNHGFLAATIGGLADWFAVTALFRKPLGIGFRTEILKRNRKRIMDAIVEFVSNDLLNTANIMRTVREENTAALLIDYFNNNDGRRKIKQIVFELLVEIAAKSDTQKIARSTAPLIQKEIYAIDAGEVVKKIVDVIIEPKHSKKILTFICEAGQSIFHSSAVQSAVLQKITSLRRDYEGTSAGRAFVLSAIELNDDKILSILNENVDKKIADTVKSLKGEDVDPNVQNTANDMVDAFGDFIQTNTSDVTARTFVRDVKEFFTKNFDVTDYTQLWLDKNLKGITYSGNKKIEPDELNREEIQWRAAVEQLVDNKIDNFINSPMQQDAFDRFVKKSVEKILDDYHETIPDLINERLNKLDDEQLTEFVESRVSDDLQMIRINGAVCGACVGITLYIISQLLKF